MPSDITIATSIAPRNIELQQAAIASWQKLGFAVISVNSQPEIEALHTHFPSVTFAVAHKTAADPSFSPYVLLDDLLTSLADCGAEICGIINADILLDGGAGFADFVAGMTRDGLLFGSRIDIASPAERSGTVYFTGFDFFFFDRSLLPVFPASRFCLGAPWWDYWVPSVLLAKGIPCRELITSVAFHLRHGQKWLQQLHQQLGEQFIAEMAELSRHGYLPEELMQAVARVRTDTDFEQFSYAQLRFIWERSEQVALSPAMAGPLKLRIGRDNVRWGGQSALAPEAFIETLVTLRSKEIARLSGPVRRLTAPLRKLADLVRKP